MITYIALLRGINVGGKNKVKMAELKGMFESIGFSRVETYIQSGNVLFEAEEEETEEDLRRRIESEFAKVFGFTVIFVLRTAVEWERIIKECPFPETEIREAEAENTEGESMYVALLLHAPSQEKAEQLGAVKSGSDECRIRGRDAYLLLRQSIRNSKLAISLQKLDVSVTVRNWKTMNKLSDMVKARSQQ